MKNIRSFWTYGLLATIFIAAFGSVNMGFAQTQPAEWTLMFYMDSDNDLEDPQMVDLQEMMAVGGSANINIVVLADRSLKGDDEEGYTNRAVGGLKNWFTAKLLVVEKGKLRELSDWGEVNMGAPETLKKFLQTVVKQFPAKKYGLTFGNHGAGWVGIVGDESAGGDSLDTNELPSVFKETTAKSGKFEFIGFDACLMANFETAKSIAPFGKTMVASEELEPGDGWHYTPMLNALTMNPQMDGVAFGKIIVDTFRNYYLGPSQGNRDKSVTLSVIDLGKIPELEKAISNFGQRSQVFMNSDGRKSWIKTSQARKATEEFGQSDDGSSQLYDLIDYAENIKREQPDPETVKSADAVINSVKTAVAYKISGAAHPRSSGLSIYFPHDKKTLLDEGYTKTPFSIAGKWLPFLTDYTGATLADTEAPQVQNVSADKNEIVASDVITVTANVEADDIAEATFIIAESHDDEQIIIGAIPSEADEDGVLSEEWDGSWFSIGDGEKDLICPITNIEELEDEQDTYIAEVPAQVRFKGSKQWRDVTLYFYLDFDGEDVVGEFIYAFAFNGNQAREVDINTGDSIRPVYLSIDNDGESSLIASDDEDDILNFTADDGVAVGRIDVAAGKYLIGFAITDYAGNTSEDYTEVTVE